MARATIHAGGPQLTNKTVAACSLNRQQLAQILSCTPSRPALSTSGQATHDAAVDAGEMRNRGRGPCCQPHDKRVPHERSNIPSRHRPAYSRSFKAQASAHASADASRRGSLESREMTAFSGLNFFFKNKQVRETLIVAALVLSLPKTCQRIGSGSYRGTGPAVH